ncbi:MAG: hypothetical protein QM802_11645 [Agriterribacter sp.]
MTPKELLTDINASVKDIIRMGFELTKTQSDYVPNHEDPGLTFETGQTKKAKTIETCVLYADIRSSTMLSKSETSEVMAWLCTAFTKSVMNAAAYHGGVIRHQSKLLPSSHRASRRYCRYQISCDGNDLTFQI